MAKGPESYGASGNVGNPWGEAFRSSEQYFNEHPRYERDPVTGEIPANEEDRKVQTYEQYSEARGKHDAQNMKYVNIDEYLAQKENLPDADRSFKAVNKDELTEDQVKSGKFVPEWKAAEIASKRDAKTAEKMAEQGIDNSKYVSEHKYNVGGEERALTYDEYMERFANPFKDETEAAIAHEDGRREGETQDQYERRVRMTADYEKGIMPKPERGDSESREAFDQRTSFIGDLRTAGIDFSKPAWGQMTDAQKEALRKEFPRFTEVNGVRTDLDGSMDAWRNRVESTLGIKIWAETNGVQPIAPKTEAKPENTGDNNKPEVTTGEKTTADEEPKADEGNKTPENDGAKKVEGGESKEEYDEKTKEIIRLVKDMSEEEKDRIIAALRELKAKKAANEKTDGDGAQKPAETGKDKKDDGEKKDGGDEAKGGDQTGDKKDDNADKSGGDKKDGDADKKKDPLTDKEIDNIVATALKEEEKNKDTVHDLKKEKTAEQKRKGLLSKIGIAALSTLITAGVVIGGIHFFKNGKKAENNDQNKQQIEDTMPEEEEPEVTPEEDGNEETENNQEEHEAWAFHDDYSYWESGSKVVPGERSQFAYCAPEEVIADTLAAHPELSDYASNPEHMKELNVLSMMELASRQPEVAAAWAAQIFDATGGAFFSEFLTNGNADEAERIVDNMSAEDGERFLAELERALRSASLEQITLNGDYSNSYIADLQNGDHRIADRHEADLVGQVKHENNTEATRLVFHDENGNEIGHCDLKVNLFNAETVTNEDGSISIVCRDSNGNVLHLCYQMVSPVGSSTNINLPPPPAERTPDTPVTDDSKDPEAIARNAGERVDQQPAGEETNNPVGEMDNFNPETGTGESAEYTNPAEEVQTENGSAQVGGAEARDEVIQGADNNGGAEGETTNDDSNADPEVVAQENAAHEAQEAANQAAEEAAAEGQQLEGATEDELADLFDPDNYENIEV